MKRILRLFGLSTLKEQRFWALEAHNVLNQLMAWRKVARHLGYPNNVLPTWAQYEADIEYAEIRKKVIKEHS